MLLVKDSTIASSRVSCQPCQVQGLVCVTRRRVGTFLRLRVWKVLRSCRPSLRVSKSIPPVWFYDERGSRLFEDITQLPEYYPTRAERALLQAHASSIAELSKADTLVELGAGACEKTRVLLTALQEFDLLARYVPFDVSDEFLRSAAATLAQEYDALDIHVVIGDFHQHLGEIPTEGRRMIAFLGGTIGNLNPAQRARFLFDLNCTMSSDDSLLIGTDLVKDRARLVAAYDDDDSCNGDRQNLLRGQQDSANMDADIVEERREGARTRADDIGNRIFESEPKT